MFAALARKVFSASKTGSRSPLPRVKAANSGYSLLEVLVAIAVIAIAAGTAIPWTLGSIERSRALAAASYVRTRMAMARFEAVKRSAYVALRFAQNGDGYWLRAYVDGNRNGVLAADIERDIDTPITADERLDYHFPGTAFGIHAGVTALGSAQPLQGDPIQIGSSALLSFSPSGSSTSGTLFIRGERSQFAVRILGATGRTRMFEFSFEERVWKTR
jgi:prepilin-type N-terminal cleavage/methylation domain-containing protein